MKWGVILILLVTVTDLSKIARINVMKKSAEKAIATQNWDKAITDLSILIDSLGVADDAVILNLAHAYMKKDDPATAGQIYSRLTTSQDPEIRSVANMQLGVVNFQQNKIQEALAFFKNSLKANPANDEARYNYELTKKMTQEQQDKQNDNDKIEPSEYAKQLKEQADRLATQNLFGQALQLMQKGLKEDKTVAAYNDYIAKLNDVVASKE